MSNKRGKFESISNQISKFQINEVTLFQYTIYFESLFDTTFKAPDFILEIAFEGMCTLRILLEAVLCKIQIVFFRKWHVSTNVLERIFSG